MLIEFSVTNFRSIADTQTLSLSAGKTSASDKQYSIETGHSYVPSVLRAVGIFGPNGAGKSALVKAIDFFQEFVKDSFKTASSKIEVEPHVYDKQWRESPTTFEIIFLNNGNLYQYGFSLDVNRVYDEWLFIKEPNANNRMKTVFTRSYDEDSGEYNWNLNKNILPKDREVWKRSTRDNALYLSTSVNLNSKELNAPFNFIIDKIKMIRDPRKLVNSFSVNKIVDSEENWKSDIISFLSDVDIKMRDIKADVGDFDADRDLPSDMPEEFKNTIIKGMKDSKVVLQLDTVRKDMQGNDTLLSFDEESSGSQVLFALSAPIIHVLRNGLTLIIDEMNSTLHPLAVRYLVSLFNDEKSNSKGAQLLFTGHETSVLEQDVMHADQVWLVEKGENLTTTLSPVSKFKSRELTNLRKSYMTGRLGGIPLIVPNEFGNGE